MQSILGNTRKMDIVFHRSGRIDIAAHVAKILSLQSGDVIDILTSDCEAFLYVRHRSPTIGRHEGMVYPSNKKGNHFRTSSKALCRYMLCRCGGNESVSLHVGKAIKDNYKGVLLPIILRRCL